MSNVNRNVCCLVTFSSPLISVSLYAATLFILSIRSQSDEVTLSDSDNSHHWCGISMIQPAPTDASGDADSEPGATVKSLIKSFDTVGQSEP